MAYRRLEGLDYPSPAKVNDLLRGLTPRDQYRLAGLIVHRFWPTIWERKDRALLVTCFRYLPHKLIDHVRLTRLRRYPPRVRNAQVRFVTGTIRWAVPEEEITRFFDNTPHEESRAARVALLNGSGANPARYGAWNEMKLMDPSDVLELVDHGLDPKRVENGITDASWRVLMQNGKWAPCNVVARLAPEGYRMSYTKTEIVIYLASYVAPMRTTEAMIAFVPYLTRPISDELREWFQGWGEPTRSLLLKD